MWSGARCGAVVAGAAIFVAQFSGVAAHAASVPTQISVWDGGGDGIHFSDVANWVGDVAPVAGNALRIDRAPCGFSHTKLLSNDFEPNFVLSGLTGTCPQFTGNAIVFDGDVIGPSTYPLADAYIGAPISLARDVSASGVVWLAALDLAGYGLTVPSDARVLGDSLTDSAGGGSVSVEGSGRIKAKGGSSIPVKAAGDSSGPPDQLAQVSLSGSWGTVDCVDSFLTLDGTMSTVRLRHVQVRRESVNGATINGDFVADADSRIVASSGSAPEAGVAFHVTGDLVLPDAGLFADSKHDMTGFIAFKVDGDVVGSFSNVADGELVPADFEPETPSGWRVSYHAGDGNDIGLIPANPVPTPPTTSAHGDPNVNPAVSATPTTSSGGVLPNTGRASGSAVLIGSLLVLVGLFGIRASRRHCFGVESRI